MAIEMLSVEVGICDGCGKHCHGGPNGEPPVEGVSGTVAGRPWFSCKKKVPGHIGKAVHKVLDAAPDEARAS